jgi:hypothetical protein
VLASLPPLAIFRGVADGVLRVSLLDGSEDKQTGSDLGRQLIADRHRGATDALNDALHGGGFYSR